MAKSVSPDGDVTPRLVSTGLLMVAPPDSPPDVPYHMLGRYRVKRQTWELFRTAMNAYTNGRSHGHTNECLDAAIQTWARSILGATGAWK